MASIIRGTTPVVKFNFSDITVSEIVDARLVVRQASKNLIERDITSAAVEQAAVSWTLTQKETLGLASNRAVTIVCDWKLENGTRGRSNELQASVEEPGINEEI